MPTRDDDNLGDIPRMRPEQDEIASYQRNKETAHRSTDKIAADVKPAKNTGSAKASGGRGLTVVLLIAVIALAAAAGFFYMETQKLMVTQGNNSQRLADLESRLSNTGSEIEQSAVAMQVRLKEMDFEIRKLWDNVWKKSKDTLAQHDENFVKQGKQIAEIKKTAQTLESRLKKIDSTTIDLKQQINKSKSLAADVSQLKGQAIALQASIESLQEKMDSVLSQSSALQKKITDHEEWIQSINAHRRQVNSDLESLKRNAGLIPAQ